MNQQNFQQIPMQTYNLNQQNYQINENTEDISDQSQLQKIMKSKQENHRVEIRKKDNIKRLNNTRIKLILIKEEAKQQQFANTNLLNQNQENNQNIQISQQNDLQYQKMNIDPYQQEEEKQSSYSKITNNDFDIAVEIGNFIKSYEIQDLEVIKDQLTNIRMELLRAQDIEPSKSDYILKTFYESRILKFVITFIEPHYKDNKDLQICAFWIISIALAGAEDIIIHEFLNEAVVKTLFNNINNEQVNMRAFAVNSISNLISERHDVRDVLVLEYKMIDKLCQIYDSMKASEEYIYDFCHLLTNITSGGENGYFIEFKFIRPLLDILQDLMLNFKNNETVVLYIFTCFENISGMNDDIKEILVKLHSGLILNLFNWLNNPDNFLSDKANIMSALATLRNLTYGFDETTQRLTHLGLLDILYKYARHKKIEIAEITAFSYSNICASQIKETQDMIVYDQLQLNTIIYLCEEDKKFGIKRNGLIAMSNLLSMCDDIEMIDIMHTNGFIEIILNNLNFHDIQLEKNLLEGLESFFLAGEQIKNDKSLNQSPYVRFFEMKNGFTKLRDLADSHNSPLIQELALKLVKFYEISDEEQEDDQD